MTTDVAQVGMFAVGLAAIGVVYLGYQSKKKLEDLAREGSAFLDEQRRKLQSGGPQVAGWLFAFGDDVYNPMGYYRFAYNAIVNNCVQLEKAHGDFKDYVKTLSEQERATLGTYDTSGRFWPHTFHIRRNLCKLPFSGELFSGTLKAWEPGACAALRDFIWSDWDKMPDRLMAARGSTKLAGIVKEARAMVAADRESALEMESAGDQRAYTYKDRADAIDEWILRALNPGLMSLKPTAAKRQEAEVDRFKKDLDTWSKITKSGEYQTRVTGSH